MPAVVHGSQLTAIARFFGCGQQDVVGDGPATLLGGLVRQSGQEQRLEVIQEVGVFSVGQPHCVHAIVGAVSTRRRTVREVTVEVTQQPGDVGHERLGMVADRHGLDLVGLHLRGQHPQRVATERYELGQPMDPDPRLPEEVRLVLSSFENPADLGGHDLQVDLHADGDPLQEAAEGMTSVTFAFPPTANHVLKRGHPHGSGGHDPRERLQRRWNPPGP